MIQLAQAGVWDALAWLSYGLLLALIVYRLVKRRGSNPHVLLALAALCVFGLGASGGTSHAWALIDANQGKPTFPSEGFAQRLARHEPTRINLSAPDTLGEVYLERLHVTGASESITLSTDSLYVDNPLATDGAKRMFNLETEILQAMSSLQRTTTLFIYRMTGGDGEAREDVILDAARQVPNAELRPLNPNGSVPLDAGLVLIDNPQRDLSEAQAQNLTAYLARGGKLLLLTDCLYGAMPMLNAVMSAFGLEAVDGAVMDPRSSLSGYPEYPLPENGEHVIGRTLQAAARQVSMPLCHAIGALQRTGVTQWAILQTSEDSYVKHNSRDDHNLEYATGDAVGPFAVAMAAQSESSRAVWIGSTDMMTVRASGDVGGANQALIRASILWLAGELVEPIEAKPIG